MGAEVIASDDATLTATIGLRHRARLTFPQYEIGGTLVGAVSVDGGGDIIINGHFHPVPPRGPESAMLEQLVQYLAVGAISDITL